MSLLNDMLKDLDKRASHTQATLALPPLHHYRTKIQISLIISLTTLLLLPGIIYLTSGKHWSTAPPQKPQMTIQLPLVSKVEPVPLLASVAEPRPSENGNPLANAHAEDLSDEDSAFDTLTPEFKEALLDETLARKPALVQKKMTSLTPEEWHDEHLNKAFEAIEDGNSPRAVDLLTLILTQFPASIEARESLAAVYLSQEELNLAYDVLNKGLEFEPHNFRLLTMKSRLLVEQGQHREALALLEQFKPDIHKEPEYYGVMAAIFETLGRTTEAGSLYQTLVGIEPSNGQYWLGFAIALENKKSTQQAIQAYMRASQSENAQPSVRVYAETRLKTLQG